MENKSPSDKSKLFNNNETRKVPFAVVEAYKHLRVQLLSLLAKTNSKVFAVTSPNASEGKSTTAVNIAIILSHTNKKVLILDADARRSTIHQKLKLENKLGALDVLTGSATIEQVINKYNPYLDIITSGSFASGSSELYSSMEFDRMLAELKENYDYIVVDTPPVNLVSDSLVISQKCDGVLLIARTSFTSYASFMHAVSSIEKLNINLLGAILNGVGSRSDKYYHYDKYKYGYGYGYGYGYDKGYGYYGRKKHKE